MAHTNGFITSDDELSAEALATGLMNYEFQSELSDSDAPDPIALDEITQPFVPAPAPPPPLPPQKKMPNAPMEIVSDLEPPIQTNGWCINGHVEWEDRDVQMLDSVAKSMAHPIEVVLNWITPNERAAYEYFEVEEYVAEDYDARRKKRLYGVSHGGAF
ncbi:hypothetical protein QBC38DRAFT_474236 [Podospora fimiseda]|uniref:Uncharacterized protein n=1 Tax=Podospora fimiseda TaxID=252190 RepID=A0AAN7GWX8_9PEZI|nr:hypothetical protein QBC38DRAFT_474236 [Podospora fimiseda]